MRLKFPTSNIKSVNCCINYQKKGKSTKNMLKIKDKSTKTYAQ